MTLQGFADDVVDYVKPLLLASRNRIEVVWPVVSLSGNVQLRCQYLVDIGQKQPERRVKAVEVSADKIQEGLTTLMVRVDGDVP